MVVAKRGLYGDIATTGSIPYATVIVVIQGLFNTAHLTLVCVPCGHGELPQYFHYPRVLKQRSLGV